MVLHVIAACVLTALAGYLLGSVLFGVLVSKTMYNEDVRDHGSGNAGMTNVLRTYGALPAILTIVGDVGKERGGNQSGLSAVYNAHWRRRHAGSSLRRLSGGDLLHDRAQPPAIFQL